MAIPTVDSGDEVRAVDHNSIVGLLNGTPDDATTAYAQPVKLNRFNDPALYSLTVGNQDTTNGLIAQFQYGTVGSATTVVSIRKRGIEARLIDNGGQVFHLEHYAPDGYTLVAATGDSAAITALEATTAQLTANDTAWTAALAAIQAVGGGVLQLPPGTLIAPSSAVVLVDNLTVAGAGMYSTVLKHRKDSSYGWLRTQGALQTFISAGVFRNNCTFRDFAIDGDRTHNNNANTNPALGTTGLIATELSAEGTNNLVARVRVFNWNHTAMSAAGTRNSIFGCRIEGPLLGSYTAFPTGDYGGFYGIAQPGNTATSYNTVLDNVVYGCRINGLTSVGDHAVIAHNVVYDNNRTVDTGASDGGQISLGSYIVSGSSHAARYGIIAFNTVGGSTLGAAAHGIEINTGFSTATVPGSDVICIGNAVSGQTAFGISCNDANGVLILGNTVRGSALGGIVVTGLFGAACLDVTVSNNLVADTAAGANVYGIHIGAGCVSYSVTDNKLRNNGTSGTTHYLDGALSATRHVWGNLVGSGTAPANYVATDVTLAATLTVTGGQIAFPSTQVPSAGANTLDDYEEGTFNFNLGGNESLAVKAGVYTKIGNLVTFNGRITVTTIGTGSTGTISGLPFSATGAGGATIGYWASSATNYYSLSALISGSTIVIYGQTTLDGSMAAATFFQNAADIVVSGAYTV